MSTIEANTLKPISGSSTLTLGESGDTVTLASGASSSGFGATLTGSTDNTVVTVTGANAMQGEANLTFDGTDLDVGASAKIFSNGAIANFSNHNGSATETALATSDGNEKVRCFNEGKITFETDGSERMRIRSNGYTGVVKTAGDTYIQRRFSVYGSHVSEDGLVWIQTSNGSGDTNLMLFFDGNTNNCGEITLNASANTVSYNSSSDYRLKQNATSISNGITRLKQLKPYRFQWKSDPDTTVDGFFAHEAQEVVPEAVHGTKDAMKTAENVVINSDGSIECYNIPEADWKQGKIDGKYASDSTWQATKEVIDRQSMDNAKLVPLLTSALQEAITKIETLETKVKALEEG